MMVATQTLQGCDMMQHVPSPGWNWHPGMRQLPLRAKLLQDVPVEALCTNATSQREKA